MPYANIDDALIWYDVVGDGEPLVLLHPGLTDSRALAATADVLAGHFRVYTPERRGHGRTPDVPGEVTFEAMGAETVSFMEQVVGGPARLVGVSDGAMVAAVAASMSPRMTVRLACIAGPAHMSGWIPAAIDPANEPPEFFAKAYSELTPDGAEHFSVIVSKIATAHLAGPTLDADDLGRIAARALVMVADDDEVTLEHAVWFYRSLPRGELAVIPGTSHGLLVEKADLCHHILVDFLLKEPAETLAPVRRVAR